ncbi:MAG: tetratricopeptide repeat protein [bacterium]
MKLRELLLPLLLVCACAGAYHNSFDGDFLFDDHGAIRDNVNIRALWPPWRAAAAAPESATARRPLAALTLAVNYAAGRLDVRGYHLVNLAIHAAATLLLFGVVRRTLAGTRLGARYRSAAPGVAAAIALVWSVHPLLTDAVDYVVHRTELLMALCLLAALYAVIRAAASRAAGRWHAAAIVASLLGALSQETMVCAPLVVLFYDRTFLAGSFGGALRARRGLYAGLAASWAVLAALALFVPTATPWSGMLGPNAGLSYAFTQPSVVVHYIRLAFWPSPLLLDYDGWKIARSAGEALPSLAIVGALLAATIWALRRRPAVGFVGAVFFLLLAPTSSVFPNPAQIAAEHRMYLPLAAIVTIVVLGAHALAGRFLRGRALSIASTGAVVLIAGLLGSATIARNLDYRDERGMWQDVLAKRPNSPRARVQLGITQMRRGQLQPALDEYRTASTLRPEWAIPHFHAAGVLRALGKQEENVAALREAVRLDPKWSEAQLNLGAALVEAGRLDEAVEHLRALVAREPDWAEAHNNLGFALSRQGKPDEAMREFEEALRANPSLARTHNNLGKAFAAQGKNDEALARFTEALRLDPNLLEAWNGLGLVKVAQGKREEASRHFQEALRIDPRFAEAHMNLAMTLFNDGRIDEALRHAEQAIMLRPDFAPGHHSAALLLSRAGRAADAIAQLREAVRLAPEWTEALNNLAWALATSSDASLRDGAQATVLAERACAGVANPPANLLDTLAAAYAETARFADATRTADAAVDRANAAGQTALAAEIALRRDLYRARRPFHEPS